MLTCIAMVLVGGRDQLELIFFSEASSKKMAKITPKEFHTCAKMDPGFSYTYTVDREL